MNHLLSTHELKVVCSTCSVDVKEITYTLKCVVHNCASNILICKAKGSSKWRPVARRPEFPRPSKYEVCLYFSEGNGCSKHKNRCTFARSTEEATVWNCEKLLGLDHIRFCKLLDQTKGDPCQLAAFEPGKVKSLDDLIEKLDFKAACTLCSVKEQEITYTIKRVSHQCGQYLFLAKFKGSHLWRPVSDRPLDIKCGSNIVYQVCQYFEEGFGCTSHGQRCTFARSIEEACLWNFAKNKNMDNATISQLISRHEVETNSMTPESIAKDILKEFSGAFLELCEDCFLSSPQKVMVRSGGSCMAVDQAHTWNPILVHHVSESQGKEVYNKVRPLPMNCKFEYCSHVSQGKPCWHKATQCHAAHSEVEMAMWRADGNEQLIRLELLRLSKEQQLVDGRKAAFYCKACLLTLSSEESFLQHCASEEHAQIISGDTTAQWETRPPPHNKRAELGLCERPNTCEYGDSCLNAHSEEELREWQMRVQEEKEIRTNIDAQGLMSYAERLREEYMNSSIEAHIISEHVDDVSITCDEELLVECEQTNVRLQWNFQVDTERQLVHVALLKHQPGANFSLDEITTEPSCSYSSGKRYLSTEMQMYNITVWFTSVLPGLYEQWLALDFDMRPVLLQKLKVRVGKQSPAFTEEPTASCGVLFQSYERWHLGNRVIVPCLDRTEEHDELLRKYKPPQAGFSTNPVGDCRTPLNAESYREEMHNFLYREEQAEDELVSRIGVRGEMTTSKSLQMKGTVIAHLGELFCVVSAPFNLTPDTPEGYVLRRSIQSGLIAPLCPKGQSSKVYEAIVLKDTTNKNKMHLKLSSRCCFELQLKSGETQQMELQFQLDRLRFCIMHKAIDLLPDTKIVLPDLENCEVPVNSTICHNLNAKQQSAIDFVLGQSNSRKDVAPLLIYGPFGTGKTFTLATAARELTRKPQNKVLICTHTNSSADLYIKANFHSFIINGDHSLKPIRIKSNKHGASLQATDDTTLKYCLLSKSGTYFLPPTKEALDNHKIVITTSTMARSFHELNLPKGYFTHILIDEASQMLECEALIPLGLAGPSTRVVLAGDHMQMGPKLFSVDDHQRSKYTLLNRLFHYYQGQNSDAAQKSRTIFNKNYRSTKEIVEFVSTQFYVGKGDIIKWDKNVPGEPNDQSLKFHHIRGDCHLDTVSMSWFNNAEVAKVVEVVEDVVRQWPLTWGTRNLSSICVLSEGWQVRKVRTALWKKNLEKVNVENFPNVQGKEFRVVIITAVQTGESLTTAHLPGMELFNDARVLNTAMTRAQSLVVVVGDATALCCFGKCSGIWKRYIDHCISKGSAEPKHLTKDFLESDIEEMSKFQRPEHSDESHRDTDTILQQLKEEYDQCETAYSSDEDHLECGLKDVRNPSHITSVVGNDNPLQMHESTDIGQLVVESFNSGYVVPFKSPTTRIPLRGKKNLGRSFDGDEVVVERFISDGVVQNRISDNNTTVSKHILVCTIEDQEHFNPQTKYSKFLRRMMVPIAKNPKICILISKKNWNLLPLWKKDDDEWQIETYHKLNENLTQNHVFMVQVICWKENYTFPLGYVINILPIGKSLDDGLRILNEEFQLTISDSKSKMDEERSNQGKKREDLRGIITFTVDPKNAKDLDDAISIKDIGEEYELGVHIADVISFVRPGDHIDVKARGKGATYYNGQREPVHMFPKDLSTRQWSLLPGCERKVVSLMLTVKKETNEIIGEGKFQLSLISSDTKLSYEDAEKIICQKSGEDPKFNTVEDCVVVAYHFSKAQRKIRLQDWAYAQTDKERLPGKRKAHLMIEEVNVLFNAEAAKILTSMAETRNCTPLRCQAKPDPNKVERFKEKHRELVPLSLHLRRKVGNDQQVANGKSFCILTKVWNDIEATARAGWDFDKIVDLIAADDIHPQLIPLLFEFKKCLGKAYFIRSDSSEQAKAGHYSLNLPSYTQASSPIRRYIDIVLQRLLHAHICGTPVQYSPQEIDILCEQFEKTMKSANDYEKKADIISLAVNIKKQNISKLAVVVSADLESDSFTVSFPFDKDVFPDRLPIMYRDLQLEDQPIYDKTKDCMVLTWRRRVYTFAKMNMHKKVTMLQNSGCCTELPFETWKAIVDAVEKENWKDLQSFILGAKTKQLEKGMIATLDKKGHDTKPCTSEDQHYMYIEVHVRPGDILQIQMTSEVERGYLTPTVQLMSLNEKLEICVDHAHSPITSFSKIPIYRTKGIYLNIDEYIGVWKPLCEMESAETAVGECDSIVIEDLVVNFCQMQGCKLNGSFNLPPAYMKKWAIEFNLAKCLLCIRKRDLKLTETLDQSKEVDPSTFTWVAHGVTEKVEELKNENKTKKVDFYVNHLPMKNIPDCVLQKDKTFTVEFIPKLVPDIRKESAVINIPRASDLVQRIALGQPIPREAVQHSIQRWQLMRAAAPAGLPTLNPSQYDAVEKALNNSFTLIQGPPGTGKTVVGVYIVSWFLELNTQTNRRNCDPKDKDKKEVVLYCGPSNKSVDVVAEFLLKFGDKLRPLRVYSEQVETLDYPYPGSSLQLSHSSLRQEPSKAELRGITMHHRMRQDHNPHSKEINKFDGKIRLAEELTDDEVIQYKKLLRRARKYELERHDVILCTCTVSSSPGLHRSISARQILIDECAMATEPQALIPLVCYKPEKIVLLGDHMQLRPIVKNHRARNLGMSKSLFERYFKMHKQRVVVLDTQYRMHEDICQFPSEAYYHGVLKTEVRCPDSVLRVDGKPKQIVFGHIPGKEISLVVSTKNGNENSKANVAEQNEVVKIAQQLVKNAKVKEEHIVILSPYNAQVSGIKDKLQEMKMNKITVTTVTKSQGSEWLYVIISTVRSLPSEEIVKEPDPGWRSKHVGFVGDCNQINVGITRAKEGLCIIGNQELLKCSPAWNKLLKHYNAMSSITNARNITVNETNKDASSRH